MNKKLLTLGAFSLAIFAVIGAYSQVSAYRGDFAVPGPNHTEEREEQMIKVMEEKDYEEWKTLMTEDGRNPGVLRKIDSQEEFDKFAQAYTLAKEGKEDEANAIRSELNLGNRQGNGGQHRGGNGDGICNNAE